METKNAARWLILLVLLLSACNITSPGTASPVIPVQEKQTPAESVPPALTPAPTATVIPTVTGLPTVAPTAEPASQAPAYGKLRTYQGAGFSLQYPANARVETKEPEAPVLSHVDILGPDIFIKPGNADWTIQGYGYWFTVRTYTNPNRLDAEAWAQDYFQTLLNNSQAGPSVGPIAQALTVVAGYPAYKAGFFGGDSEAWVYYLADRDQIIALSFNIYPVENQPIALVQQDIYALILGTFRMEPATKSLPSDMLQSYQDPVFSLQYPANAQVASVSPSGGALSEVQVTGPDIFIKPGDADWTIQDHGYQLTVQTYSNPRSLDVEAWARDFLLTDWQQAQGGPYMGPVLEGGQIDAGRVGKTTVAGYPAFWANFFVGDSSVQVFYLSNQDQIAALRFREYPLANQPIALVQQDIAAMLMGMFRFMNGTSVP